MALMATLAGDEAQKPMHALPTPPLQTTKLLENGVAVDLHDYSHGGFMVEFRTWISHSKLQRHKSLFGSGISRPCGRSHPLEHNGQRRCTRGAQNLPKAGQEPTLFQTAMPSVQCLQLSQVCIQRHRMTITIIATCTCKALMNSKI